MKISVAEKVLEILQSSAETTVGILDIISSGYSGSYRKMRRGMLGKGGFRFKTDWAEAYRDRQTFYSLLNKLKKDGLIRKKDEGHSSWHITKRGIEQLELRKQRRTNSHRWMSYPKISSPTVILVMFDIPEREQQKRVWLRAALRALNFSLLQHSVWIGKNKIPEEFIRDLKNREMLRWIHIVEITRQGTVEFYGEK